MSGARIARIALTIVGVSARSNWSFVEVTLDDGRTGTGEASLHGYEPLLAAWLDQHRPRLLGERPECLPALLPVGRRTRAGLVAHAAISALEQARTDLEAAARGLSIARHLGAPGPVSVPLYANLNRGLTDRSPASFAAQAAAAAAAGFARIKVAPFDGVTPDSADGQANEARLRAGLDRIAALREALAPGVSLMVDCHWRLTPERAGRLVGDLAALGVSWLECPLPETPANFAAIAGLRRAATAAGMVLAGAELEIGVAGFLPFLDLYDVVMPDVKYCGGPAELLRIADAARARGCRIAPHNPSGPIAHAHSVHLAAHPAVDLLEHQFGESGLFGTLTTGGPPPIAAGTARSGDAPGLGAALDPARCAANPQRPIVSLD